MRGRPDKRDGDSGDAVRVLPPDHEVRRDPPGGAFTPSPPSRVSPVIVAAVIGVLAFAGFLTMTSNDPAGDAETETETPATTAAPVDTISEQPAARTFDLTTPWAGAAGIGNGAVVADAVVGSGSLVAAGSTGSRAAVWSSNTGDRWTAASVEQEPAGSESRLEAISYGDGDWLGVGTVDGAPAVWRATTWRRWDSVGPQPDLSDLGEVIDLVVAPGPQFWIVSAEAGRPVLWVSTDAVRWTKRDPGFTPDEISVTSAAAREGDEWLYLAGSECREGECRPALWKTQDGIAWAAVEVSVGARSSESEGELASIVASPLRIVAAGWMDDDDVAVPVVWYSKDGSAWASASRAAMAGSEVPIRLTQVSDSLPATVSLTVAGRRVQAAVGDVLLTEVGELTIEAAEAPLVTLRFGNETFQMGTGAFSTLRLSQRIERVAVTADRIVATGIESAPNGSGAVPVAWTSTDGGATWNRGHLPSGAEGSIFPGQRAHRFMAVAENGSSWVGEWDADGSAVAAIAVVERFLAAIGEGDLPGVVGSVAASVPRSEDGIELPGLAPVAVDWWNDDSGLLELESVAGTIAFVRELAGSVQLNDCTARHAWDGLGRIRVECDIRSGSDFMAALGVSEERGALTAMVAQGRVLSVTSQDGSHLWNQVERWARTVDPAAAAATYGSADDPRAEGPRLDATLAADALEWARRFQEADLVPGESIVTPTPLGDMEWSVVEPFEDDESMSIHAVRGAFWAFMYPGGGLWSSDDGVEWDQVAESPTGLWWSPLMFADRLVVTQAGNDGPLLHEWTGDEWRAIETDPYPEEGDWALRSAVESDGKILIIGEGWEPNFGQPVGKALWALSATGDFELVTVEGPDLSGEREMQIVGWDSGFVMLLQSSDLPATTTEVWASADGATWELLTGDAGIEHWIDWVGLVEGDLVARVWTGRQCEGSGAEQVCRPGFELWRSPDGAQWTRDSTGEAFGPIGAGPLGMVALTSDLFEGQRGAGSPITVSIANESGPFVAVDGLSVLMPGASVQWPGGVAMTDATIVIPIFGEFEDPEHGYHQVVWLLVGEVLEP